MNFYATSIKPRKKSVKNKNGRRSKFVKKRNPINI